MSYDGALRQKKDAEAVPRSGTVTARMWGCPSPCNEPYCPAPLDETGGDCV
jgi:hypothetical protein